jgi:hypothetical protein
MDEDGDARMKASVSPDPFQYEPHIDFKSACGG